MELQTLIKAKILSPICEISSSSSEEEVRQMIASHGTGTSYAANQPSHVTQQAGRLWILTGKHHQEEEVLTLGQSQDILKEITTIIYKIFGTKEPIDFYEELRASYDSLTFYEVAIDAYLIHLEPDLKDDLLARKRRASQGQSTLVDLFFDMSKEYFVEANLAYSTAAKYWNFFRSGMDKRYYYHLLDNLKKKKKASQSEKGLAKKA